MAAWTDAAGVSTLSAPSSLGARCREAVLRAVEELGGEGSRRDILARAEQLAAFSAQELSRPAPELARHKYVRLVDHQLSWALTDLKRRGRLENPRWSHWQVPKPPTAPGALAEPVTTVRLHELATMPYREYLKTLEWQHTRLAALRRAEHRCQLDASHDRGRLDVHHSSYERRGAELVSDLVVLCADCHAKHHGTSPAPAPAASAGPPAPQRASAPARSPLAATATAPGPLPAGPDGWLARLRRRLA